MTATSRRIAVVPAYNEEPTVAAVLDELYPLVDEEGAQDPLPMAAWLSRPEPLRRREAAYYLPLAILHSQQMPRDEGGGRFETARSVLDAKRIRYNRIAGCARESVWIGPAEAHGMWIEFNQPPDPL